ncbi:MAG: alpha/beta hydrolase [Alphaproteobacteria bacterium]|nr:alpha/beta hydrolase [Alphaproteobacteria bacterium]
MNTVSAVEARRLHKMGVKAAAGTPPEMASVRQFTVPTPSAPIPVRLYRPQGAVGDALPLVVYFHGGGWVIGDLDTHDAVCRGVADAFGGLILSVEYRKAPEAPFPAAVEDCWAATRWAAAHAAAIGADAARLAVGGDSAGGNLAAVVCQLAKTAGAPRIRFQSLVYPAVDMTMGFPSVKAMGQDYNLTEALMVWFIDQYLGTADRRDPRASPLFAADLSGLPPAQILTARFDPLHDEGKAYAEALRGAGVRVAYHCYEDMIHAFVNMPGFIDAGREAHTRVGLALREALG